MIGLGLDIEILACRGIGSQIRGLEPLFWLDPSDLTTMFQDTAGTTPVTSDNDPARRIGNQGTAGGSLLAPSDAARPTYQTDGIKHWLEFDGSNDVLETSAAIAFSADVFEAVGYRTISINKAFAHVVSNRGTTAADTQQRHPLFVTPQSNGASFTVSWGGQGTTVTAGATLVGVDTVVTSSCDASSRDLNVNGDTASGAGVTLADGSTDPYRIGGPNNANIRYYGGMHLNRVPSAEEQTLVRTYLASISGGTA